MIVRLTNVALSCEGQQQHHRMLSRVSAGGREAKAACNATSSIVGRTGLRLLQRPVRRPGSRERIRARGRVGARRTRRRWKVRHEQPKERRRAAGKQRAQRAQCQRPAATRPVATTRTKTGPNPEKTSRSERAAVRNRSSGVSRVPDELEARAWTLAVGGFPGRKPRQKLRRATVAQSLNCTRRCRPPNGSGVELRRPATTTPDATTSSAGGPRTRQRMLPARKPARHGKTSTDDVTGLRLLQHRVRRPSLRERNERTSVIRRVGREDGEGSKGAAA